MAKVWYLGSEDLFTIRSNSTPSGEEYVFVKNHPTEVNNKKDLAKILKHNFSTKDPNPEFTKQAAENRKKRQKREAEKAKILKEKAKKLQESEEKQREVRMVDEKIRAMEDEL